MKRRQIFIFLVLLLMLSSFFTSGCINNAIENGAIHGKLYIYEGDQPALNAVKVRVEAIPENLDDNLKRLNFRYVIVEANQHGEYLIPDVVPGKYKIQFDIQNKEAGYAYLVKLGDHPTQLADYYSRDNDELPYAFVESGRDYEMPDIYIKKLPSTGKGVFKGIFVYSPMEIPLEHITIALKNNNDGTMYSAYTNQDGVAVIPDLKVGTYQIVLPTDYTFYFQNDSDQVDIVENQTLEKKFVLGYHGDNKPKIKGLVSIPSNFQEWIKPADIVGYLNIADGQVSEKKIDVKDGFYFEQEVEPWIPQYKIYFNLKEPFYSNTVIYPLPALKPGEVYNLPDNAIELEVAHKNVVVKVYPPYGYSAGYDEIIFKVSFNSKSRTFIAKGLGSYWSTTIDMPYGVAQFEGITVFHDPADETKESQLISQSFAISDNSGDVIELYYEAFPSETSGSDGTGG